MVMNISLLPEELRHQQSTTKRFSIYVITMIIVVMIFVIFLLGLLVNNYYSTSNLASVKQTDLDLKIRITEMQKYADIEAEVQKLKNKFEKASKNTPNWSDLLKFIGSALPDTANIQELSAAYAENTGSVIISGYANTYNDVSEMVSRLNKLKGISNIALSNATSVVTANREAVKFSITAIISKGEIRILDETGGSQP